MSNMEDMEKLIESVRSHLDRGVSTSVDLAKSAETTRQTIHSVLTGRHKPTLQLAERLAAAIGGEVRFSFIEPSKRRRKKNVA